MIEVKHLVKRYGTHTAVNDISFSLSKGKIYGFLGPNGAGKTTTMNILTGYLAATSGEVLVDGHHILNEPELAKKSIGYLPEIPPVYLDMTVKEYLEFAAELKGIRKNERSEHCLVIMEQLKLVDVQNRLIANLSKGYRQRVGLGQALIGYPDTIILDEPMVGLDPQQIIEMRQLIRSLAENHTIILSSHILGEVQELCDYLLIISSGKLVAQDTPENLESKYCDQETVYVEAKGNLEDLRETLSDMPNLEKIRYVQKRDSWEIEIKPKDHRDIREELFAKFAEAKCPLLSLYREKPTLETVYLTLVEEGAK